MIFERNFILTVFGPLINVAFVCYIWVTNLPNSGQYGKFQCWIMPLVGRESIMQNKEQGQDGVDRNWQSPDTEGQSLEIV